MVVLGPRLVAGQATAVAGRLCEAQYRERPRRQASQDSAGSNFHAQGRRRIGSPDVAGRNSRRLEEVSSCGSCSCSLLRSPQRRQLRDAAPPVLDTVGHTSRHLNAIWTLPPGVEEPVIEAATSPETSTDGYFFFENVEEFSTLEASQTTYTGNLQLNPGTYYVHVAGYDTACLECPGREFSAIQILTVPADPPPPLELTVGDAKRYVKVALRRRFARTYSSGYAKRVSSMHAPVDHESELPPSVLGHRGSQLQGPGRNLAHRHGRRPSLALLLSHQTHRRVLRRD